MLFSSSLLRAFGYTNLDFAHQVGEIFFSYNILKISVEFMKNMGLHHWGLGEHGSPLLGSQRARLSTAHTVL